MVICSDCYDNANIYSRTRDYCPYAYLGEDDPLDKTLPGLKESLHEHSHHEDTALGSLISNQDSSDFLTSHDKRLSSHSPPEHYTNGETLKPKSQIYLLKMLTFLAKALSIVSITLRCSVLNLHPSEATQTFFLLFITTLNWLLAYLYIQYKL